MITYLIGGSYLQQGVAKELYRLFHLNGISSVFENKFVHIHMYMASTSLNLNLCVCFMP